MRRWIPLGLLALILLWVGLRPPDAPGQNLVSREFPAMGTWIRLSIYLDADDSRTEAERAATDVEQAMHDFDRRWTPNGDGNGELAKINSGQLDSFPNAMRALLELSLDLHARTGGLFDPRLGGLIKLWGFDDSEDYLLAPPTPDQVREQMQDMALPPAQRFAGAWNFGAIAKGWVVDRCMEQLHAQGFDNVLVNAGGNLRVSGHHGDRPWRIAIRHPRPTESQRVLAIVEPLDQAIITSGDYERFFEHAGKRYHHLLDPRTGYPAAGLQSVTVFGPSAAVADAMSTALFVAGPDHWQGLAAVNGMREVLVVDSAGDISVTQSAAERLSFPGNPKRKTLP